jgi:hypothetical protein
MRLWKRGQLAALSSNEASIARLEEPNTTVRLSPAEAEWVREIEAKPRPRTRSIGAYQVTTVKKAKDGKLIDA